MIPIALAETSSTGILAAVDRFIPGGIENIFNLGLGIGAILALGTVTYAGLLYSSSGDNSSKQKEARSWIVAAAKGLALIAGGFVLLHIVNPTIVRTSDAELDKTKILNSPGYFRINDTNPPDFGDRDGTTYGGRGGVKF